MDNTGAQGDLQALERLFSQKVTRHSRRWFQKEIKRLDTAWARLGEGGAAAVPDVLNLLKNETGTISEREEKLAALIAEQPVLKTYVQAPSRTKPVPGDALWVKILKKMRSLSWKPLHQYVPVREIAAYGGLEIRAVWMELDTSIYRLEHALTEYIRHVVTQHEEDFQADIQAQLDELKTSADTLQTERIAAFFHQVTDQADTIGTLEFRASRFSARRRMKREGKQTRLIRNRNRRTREYLQVLRNDITTCMEILALTSAVTGFADETRTALAEQFQEYGRAVQNIKEFIEDEAGKLTKTASFDQIKNKLSDAISSRLLLPVEAALSGAVSTEIIDGFIRKIMLAHESLSVTVQVPEKKDSGYPPDYQSAALLLQKEMADYSKSFLVQHVRTIPAEIAGLLTFLLEETQEIDQVVDVNLDTAGGETKTDALSVAREGLSRAVLRCDELMEAFTGKCDDTLDAVTGKALKLTGTLTKLVETGDLLKIKNENRQMRLKSQAVDKKSQAIAWLSRAQDKAEVYVRFVIRWGKSVVLPVAGFLGFKLEDSKENDLKTSIAVYLSDTEKSVAKLPLIYRRLFSGESLTDEKFYKKRPEIRKVFSDAWTNWVSDHFSSFAIVGEKGSGKTTFLNLVLPEFTEDYPVHRGRLEHTLWKEHDLLNALCEILGTKFVDRDTLIRTLNEGPKRVVVLEGFQNMYLRTMNGFEALESFLLIISETSRNIFWVITSSHYAWNYLDTCMNTAGYITHIAESDLLGRDQLREIIMARHRVSGYDAEFVVPEDVMGKRSYKKLLDDKEALHEYLESRYFENLADLSQGNIDIAILIWLRSIQDIHADRLVIAPITEQPLELGDQFSSDDLITMGALLLHDDLNEAELADVLNISMEESRLRLKKLTSRSILVMRSERYQVNYLLYRFVVRLLRRKNILH